MPARGVVDPGGQIILDACFVAATGTTPAPDPIRWTNGGGDAGAVQRVDTGRLDVIAGAANDRVSFIWQTQQLRRQDQGILVNVAASATAAAELVLRAASTTWQASIPCPNSSYGLRFSVSGGFLALDGFKCAGAVFSSIGSTVITTIAFTAGDRCWFRFEANGNNLYGKVWKEGTAEPSWQWLTTDTSNLVPGRMAIASTNNNGGAVLQEVFYHSYTSYIPDPSPSILPIILQGASPSVRSVSLQATPQPLPAALQWNNLTAGTPPPVFNKWADRPILQATPYPVLAPQQYEVMSPSATLNVPVPIANDLLSTPLPTLPANVALGLVPAATVVIPNIVIYNDMTMNPMPPPPLVALLPGQLPGIVETVPIFILNDTTVTPPLAAPSYLQLGAPQPQIVEQVPVFILDNLTMNPMPLPAVSSLPGMFPGTAATTPVPILILGVPAILALPTTQANPGPFQPPAPTVPTMAFFTHDNFVQLPPAVQRLIFVALIPGTPPTVATSLPIWNTAMTSETSTLGWPTNILDTWNSP